MTKTKYIKAYGITGNKNHINAIIFLFAALYFVGCLLGALSGRMSFFSYYADSLYSLMAQTNLTGCFSSLFLPQFILFSGLVMAGYSALGAMLVPLLFILQGYNFGVMVASLYYSYGWAGIIRLWAFFWVPETVCLCLALFFSRRSWIMSFSILQSCFGKRNGSYPHEAQRLLKSYLLVSAVSAFSCVIAGFLQIQAGRFFF